MESHTAYSFLSIAIFFCFLLKCFLTQGEHCCEENTWQMKTIHIQIQTGNNECLLFTYLKIIPIIITGLVIGVREKKKDVLMMKISFCFRERQVSNKGAVKRS